MIKFIESIRVVDGVAYHLDYHFKRFSRTIKHHFKNQDEEDLYGFVSEILSKERDVIKKGVFKLRLIYSNKILSFTIDPYQPKLIKTLRLVEDNNIRYPFKYEERSEIDKNFTMRNGCDDVLIVKEGEITDTSYCNVVFEKGRILYTPVSYLLPGTARERMINEGLLNEIKIRPCDISRYDKVYLINSMLDLYPVDSILL